MFPLYGKSADFSEQKFCVFLTNFDFCFFTFRGPRFVDPRSGILGSLVERSIRSSTALILTNSGVALNHSNAYITFFGALGNRPIFGTNRRKKTLILQLTLAIATVKNLTATTLGINLALRVRHLII